MSFLELTLAAGIAATLSAVALPRFDSAIDGIRSRSAGRYVAGRLQKARQEAILRGANVALHFTLVNDRYVFAAYVDGDGDGVRNSDIQTGIDPRLTPDERLWHDFPGIDFGASPGLPAADPSSSAPGDDPIRIGASNLLSFTALGTATPGTLYLRGRRHQYAVRILGETGRVRLLEFNHATGTWNRP